MNGCWKLIEGEVMLDELHSVPQTEIFRDVDVLFLRGDRKTLEIDMIVLRRSIVSSAV